MPASVRSDNARRRKGKNGPKLKQVESGNMNVEFLKELSMSNEQKVMISLKDGEKFNRIDVAIVEPSGRGRILKAQQNNGNFVVMFNTREAGSHLASVAAYGRRGYTLFSDISFNVVNPADNGKNNGSGQAQPTRQKQIRIPKIPEKFKDEDIKSWPNSSSYAQAFQNLKFSVSKDYDDLSDGELERNTNVKYTSYIFGSGNFGTVFKLSSNGKNYAVKCFTRASPGLAERYYYIGHYISALKLPFLVDFQYLMGAVRLLTKPKQYYPLLKMEWITGKSLNEYISENIGNGSDLRKVAEGIIRIVDELQTNGLAHGDLSGDNILIDGSGKIVLIDYDGMYVPAFSKRRAPEKGHDNFQHPGRKDHFSSALDNFSSLIIYTSLLALEKKPELWDYNDGDGDKLIFSASDFKDPDNSELLTNLRKTKGKVGKLSNLIYNALKKDPLWTGISPSKIMSLK